MFMDYRRINSHIILLGMVIVVGLFAGIVVRMAMLERGADAGTANLTFVLILAASAVLYLIIISTLSNSVIPWIMKRLPVSKRKAGAVLSDNLPEDDDDERDMYSFAYDYDTPEKSDEDNDYSDEEEMQPPVVATPTPQKPSWQEQREKEFQEQLSLFREYTHFEMGAYVSAEELARLDEYVELFARELPLPKDTVPMRPARLKNPDLYHFGWNMQHYFKVGRREDVVPWLQTVFSELKKLEYSTIKGKLHDGYARRYIIQNIADIPKFMAGKRS